MKSLFPEVRAILVVLALLSLSASARTDESEIHLPGIDGTSHAVFETEGKKGVVLFFVSPYCPTSNTFGPEMNAIIEDFEASFAFRFVHSDTSVTDVDMVQHATQMGFAAPVLRDGEQAVAKRIGATITPEVVVLDRNGKTLYQGRINDLYLGPTRRQREVTSHDLRDALSAILEERAVAVSVTEAMGCEIGIK